MRLPGLFFARRALAALMAQPAHAQNGIASPIDKISPTGAVTIPQLEVPSVGTLDPVQPHWVFVNRGNGQDGTRIFDGDTGRMKGMVNMYGQDSFSFDPLGKNFYVAQTQWTKQDRGSARTCCWSMTSHSLKLVSEIAIPGRMLIGNRTHNLVITSDGKRALIYNMRPSSSVNVVDLDKRAFESEDRIAGLRHHVHQHGQWLLGAVLQRYPGDRGDGRSRARHHPFGAVLLRHRRSDLRHLDPGCQNRQRHHAQL